MLAAPATGAIMSNRPRMYVWYVSVCDYEACWPLNGVAFDSEEKASKYAETQPKSNEFEQSRKVVMMEVF